VDLRDARRLGTTCLLLTGVILAWLILLALDDADLFSWSWPTRALESLSLSVWMWIGVSTLVVLALGLVGIVFAMGLGTSAPTRQVQCGECRAVFFIGDNGRRPLTHTCPNCKAFGVYQGQKDASPPAPPKARAVGPPVSQSQPRSFACPSCKTHFKVADTGQRPLKVQCPTCHTSGMLR
jgi:hypothetical protein